MTKPTSASDWLEHVADQRDNSLFERRLIAMLRDAKAEMGMATATILKFAPYMDFHGSPLAKAEFENTLRQIGGWSAIEKKFREGGYG